MGEILKKFNYAESGVRMISFPPGQAPVDSVISNDGS